MRFEALLTLLVALVGCGDSHTGPDSGAPAEDASRGTDADVCPTSCEERPVDVLIVLQDHTALRESADRLAFALPDALKDIASGSGRSVRVGLITSDMGVGDAGTPGCTAIGDDGLLQADEGCPDLFGEVLADSMEGPIMSDVECRLSGTECVFNQPLEAALKAIAPEGAGIEFRVGAGHASGANQPFLRDDSILAILIVTGDNDCSTMNTEIFDPDSPTFDGALSLRCFQHSEELTSTARYVDSLLVSRSSDDLVYFVLGGIPPELDGVSPSELLTDPSMDERLDDDAPGRLEPSCSAAGSPVMNPPRRLLEVGDGLADRGVAVGTGSACQPRYDAALERFAMLALHTGCDCP